MEIIPAIDIIEGGCVRLAQGDYGEVTRYGASPAEMVRRYVDAGLTHIHCVDLDGAKCGKPVNLPVLEDLAAIPGARIEWGGGIKSSVDLERCVSAGASYAVIGSVAARQPSLFTEWLERYTPGVMVLGADLRNGMVSVAGWTSDTALTADDLLRQFIPFGLNQAIVTDISKDGMLRGPNFDLYSRLQTEYPDVDFTVSGGISSLNDIHRCKECGLRRVIVGKAIYEGRVSVADLARIARDS